MTITSLTLLERVRHQSLCDDGAVRRDNEAWNRLVDLYTPLLFHWSLRTGQLESITSGGCPAGDNKSH